MKHFGYLLTMWYEDMQGWHPITMKIIQKRVINETNKN